MAWCCPIASSSNTTYGQARAWLLTSGSSLHFFFRHSHVSCWIGAERRKMSCFNTIFHVIHRKKKSFQGEKISVEALYGSFKKNITNKWTEKNEPKEPFKS
jgi:hypothetical protein